MSAEVHSASTTQEAGIAPMAATAVVADDMAIVPSPAGDFCALPLLPGVHLAWQHLTPRSALLVLFFGQESTRGVATTLSADGLSRLIADLRSIHHQISDPRQAAGDGASPVPPLAGGASPR